MFWLQPAVFLRPDGRKGRVPVAFAGTRSHLFWDPVTTYEVHGEFVTDAAQLILLLEVLLTDDWSRIIIFWSPRYMIPGTTHRLQSN